MEQTRLELLTTFLNSRRLGGVDDWLLSATVAQRWLSGEAFPEHDRPSAAVLDLLAAYGSPALPNQDDLITSRQIRDLLRALIAGEGASMTLPTFPVRVRADGTRIVLEPEGTGPLGLARQALVLAYEAQQDGTWERLGVCRNDRCRWVFHDSSRNRSRAWCDMASCGAQSKMRAYRARLAG